MAALKSFSATCAWARYRAVWCGMGEQSAEASMIRSYLDWLFAVPWSKRSDERLDPVHALHYE